jgi:hypothetical protein
VPVTDDSPDDSPDDMPLPAAEPERLLGDSPVVAARFSTRAGVLARGYWRSARPSQRPSALGMNARARSLTTAT